MARLSIHSEAVRSIVQNVLVPLFVAEGSTAGACKVLNDALQELGELRTIHPNRVHTMLSEDIGRGVNETTMELIGRASTYLRDGRLPPPSATLAKLQSLCERFPPADRQNDHSVGEIARGLGMPAAVIKQALALTGGETGVPSLESSKQLRPPAQCLPGRPDWSYQDTAVARCLEALRRRPTGRIGLILPTGAGKTRTAIRVILDFLARHASPQSRVLWVTHRRTLKTQAYRELRKLLENEDGGAPENAADLANRINFVMIGDVPRLLSAMAEAPALVVIDEAHHAAAASYQPLLDSSQIFPVLLLTATPNRTDCLPIGIDEVAFTITHRELAGRHAILVPEFIPLDVPNFDWSAASVRDLVDYIIDETSHRFTKVLVLAPRVDRVEEFYVALAARLAKEEGHPLAPEDIGFIHGTDNSLGLESDDFLARFAEKPRAVLVSAQMLLEGFDDPAIDTVVITYETESVIKLMQAAGRCVRHAPGKRAAYVVQAHNPDLAYRFDQRWLYQEIDDLLRPELIDIEFANLSVLRSEVERLLREHNVHPGACERLLTQLAEVQIGGTCRLLFYGLPFYGEAEQFSNEARWGAFLETDANSIAFRGIFNEFCNLGAHLSDPTEFLTDVGGRYNVRRDPSQGSVWRQLVELLTACYFAQEERRGGEVTATQRSRPHRRHGPTTWLRYITFKHHAALPTALVTFLGDCHNRIAIEGAYISDPAGAAAAVKIHLPIGPCEALLLDRHRADALERWLAETRLELRLVLPEAQFATLAARLAIAEFPPLPFQFLTRVEQLLADVDAFLWLRLSPNEIIASQGDL